MTQKTRANQLLLANAVISNDDKQPAATVDSSEKLPDNGVSETAAMTSPNTETAVQLPEVKRTPLKTRSLLHYKLNDKSQPTLQETDTEKHRQYELQGYLNKQYVYLIVEKTGDKQIVGYVFDGTGNKKYVYGEWVNKTLQIYDPSNTKSTVSLIDNPSVNSDTGTKSNTQLIDHNDAISIQNSQVTNTTILNQNKRSVTNFNDDSKGKTNIIIIK